METTGKVVSPAGCIVLAGGKSSRFGSDKKTEIVAGQSLLERVLLRLEPLVEEIIVVTAQGQFLGPLPLAKARVVSDVIQGKGPLGGIYTGLLESHFNYNIVVASDMPFLNQRLLSYMVQVSPSYDMVVPRVGDYVEPLHSVYARSCIPVMQDLLNTSDILPPRRLMELVKVKYIDKDEIEQFDPEHISFFNINTKNDLAAALKLAERGN